MGDHGAVPATRRADTRGDRNQAPQGQDAYRGGVANTVAQAQRKSASARNWTDTRRVTITLKRCCPGSITIATTSDPEKAERFRFNSVPTGRHRAATPQGTQERDAPGSRPVSEQPRLQGGTGHAATSSPGSRETRTRMGSRLPRRSSSPGTCPPTRRSGNFGARMKPDRTNRQARGELKPAGVPGDARADCGETVQGHQRDVTDDWDYFLDRDSKIAYIRLPQFSRNTYRDMRQVLQNLTRQGMKGLVLDLPSIPADFSTAPSRSPTCSLATA